MDAIERRDLLLTLASGSILALSTEANAQTASPKPIAKTVVKAAEIKDISGLFSKAQATSAWSELKSRASALSSALSAFDVSYEEGSVAALSKIDNDEKIKLTHNQRLIEPLLGEIASLLDRCVAYRREGRELEIAGVAAGANLIATLALQKTDRDIAQINVPAEVAQVLVTQYPSAIDAFGAGGAGKQLQAERAANERLEQRSDARTALLLGRLTFTQDLELQLLARHGVDGNAHNYAERFNSVRRLYDSDIQAAYKRAKAVMAGFEAVFGIKPPDLPAVAPFGFLDAFVIWTRDAMRSVTTLAETEIEFVRDIVITIPAAATNAPVSFDVKDHFQGLQAVRLRSISLFFTSDHASTHNDHFTNGTVAAVLAKTAPETSPRIILPVTGVRWFVSGREPTTIDGSLVYNADPRGTWNVKLSGKGLLSDGNPLDRAATIKKLVVRFSVLANIDPKNDTLFWFSTEDRV